MLDLASLYVQKVSILQHTLETESQLLQQVRHLMRGGMDYGRIPDVSHFRVFGCMAYAHIPEVEGTKLDKKAVKLRFLGYSDNQEDYRLFDKVNRKVVIRRDVAFNETDFEYQKQPLKIESEAEMESEQSPEEANPQQEPQSSQRATRGQPPLKFGFDEYAEVTEVTHMALHAAIEEPATMQEAWNSKYSTQ